jgi:hypothetical protein
LARVDIFLTIRILVFVQILPAIIVLRRISRFSIIALRIVVAIARVFLTFFSRLIVHLPGARPGIARAILARTDGLPPALWLVGLLGILTSVAAVSPALSVVVIVLGYGKICQKKEDQTGP